MAWRSVDVEEQRIRFVVAASRGERSVTALCSEFDISRATGHLWLKRYQSGGVGAVAGRDADGPRHPVVERRFGRRRDPALGLADEAERAAVSQRCPTPADASPIDNA